MRTWMILITALVYVASCQPGQSWRKEQIDKKETALMESAKSGKADTAAVNSLLTAYESYATDFPKDTLAADYLFKSADFYRYMHRPAKSVALYKKIYDGYPSLAKRPYALFLEGFIYENEMGVLDSAQMKYEKFLKDYPNHPIADDIQATLNNLGKTPEQMIAEFQARQKEDSLATTNAK